MSSKYPERHRSRRNFLLLGDGNKLTLEDIRLGDFGFYDVDLLTLSACQTAVGDQAQNGREIEGLGALAQNQGAGAVLATLWSVADQSTALFMTRFYSIHEQQSVTKAEALRQEFDLRVMTPETAEAIVRRKAGDPPPS